MVYSSKDFESLWFLYQVEGLPKNISIKELTFPSVVELNLQHNSTEFMIRFIEFNGCYID